MFSDDEKWEALAGAVDKLIHCHNFIGDHVTSAMYLPGDSTHSDGTQSDILYIPNVKPTEDLPPILIEVQRKVDPRFMSRAIKYCASVFEEHGVLPILLIICVNGFSSDAFKAQFEKSDRPYFLHANCEFWAKRCYVLSKESIKDFIHETPMIDMVALGHFFTQQKRSILSLQDKSGDPTIRLLYKVAKEKLDGERKSDEAKLDMILAFCSQTQSQFEKIAEYAKNQSVQSSAESSARLLQYAHDGIELSQLQKRKYEQTFCRDVSPTDDTGTTGQIKTPVLDKDMEFVRSFLQGRQGPMSWKQCYLDGVALGLFQRYRNSTTLKSAYYKKQKKAKK